MKKTPIMMQKLHKLLCCVILLVLFSSPVFAQQAITQPLKGVLRVKLQEELPENGSRIKTRGGIAKTGVSPIDVMNSKLKVSSMVRMFPYAPKHEQDMRQHGLHLWYEIHYDNDVTPENAAKMYRTTSGIKAVDIVRPMVLMDGSGKAREDISPVANTSASFPFNDPLVGKQWHYQNDGSIPETVAGADINLYNGWKVTTGSRDVIVAIIDGGFDYKHEDLAANAWINEAELNGKEGVDDDGNGYVDDIYGWNFVRESNLVYPHEHGTHVAGTVGAVNNNGIGVAGVAGGSGNKDGVRLMSCQIFDVVQNENTDFAKAIIYAANSGANIAQCSWGWNSPDYKEQSVEEAINYFNDKAGNFEGSLMKGGLCFFATGNLGTEGDFYPSAYPSVIAVGAMEANMKVATYTNYGPAVDITAPGGLTEVAQQYAVYSTLPRNRYGYLDGTSMATPHVSGVAALVISKFGGKNFTNNDLRQHILTAVKDLYLYNPEWTGKFGRGYLDAALALKENHKKAPTQITDFQLLPSQQDIGVEWQIPNDEDDQKVESHLLYWATKPFTAATDLSTLNVYEVDTKFKEIGSTVLDEIKGLSASTEYWIAIQAVDRWGNKSVLSPVKSAETNAGPIVSFDKEFGLSLFVNVADNYVASDALTATNEGEGLLKWTANIKRKNPDYFNNYMITKASTGKIVPATTQGMRVNSRATEEIAKVDYMEEDFPKYIAYYEDNLYNIGEGDTTFSNSLAQYFSVSYEDCPDGFNLTHIKAECLNVKGKVVLQIYGNSTNLSTATLMLSDTLTNPTFETDIALQNQFFFNAGEGFWLVIHIPSGNVSPLGGAKEKYAEASQYCLYSSDLGKTWSSIEEVLKQGNLKDVADEIVWSTKAVSRYPDLGGYITLNPTEGKTATNESAVLTLQTTKMDIPDGHYDFTLFFNNNENGHEKRTFPISLDVMGHQPVLNTPRIVNFGDLFVGQEKSMKVEIANTGYGDFQGGYMVPFISSSDPQFEPDMSLYNFAPRSKSYLVIKYKPQTSGTHTATITLTDQNNLTHEFIVRGIADDPAHITVAPTTIEAGELVYGDTPKEFKTKITNTGNYPLEYVFPKFSNDSITGITKTSHKFGYSYISNLDNPDGYTYQWENIINTTDISAQINEDIKCSSAIDLGFDFPFYGKTYNKIYVTSFGALSVTGEGFEAMACRFELSSDPICIAGMGIISAIGLPLQFDKESQILYGKQNGQFIVSYENAILKSWSGLIRLSFRIVLNENGNISIYYRHFDTSTFDMGGQNIFIGCGDPKVTDPFVITDIDLVLESNYTDNTYTKLKNETAICINAPGSNMVQKIDFPSGIVAAHSDKEITLTVAADTNMYTGSLSNMLTLLSSDPEHSTSYITLNATISGNNYKPQVTLNTNTLDFGSRFRTSIIKDAITIKNTGHAPVNITAISLQNNTVNLSIPLLPYELKPGSSVDAVITIPNTSEGTFEDQLNVTAGNGQNLSATIKAKVIGTPTIDIDPIAVNETMASGTTKATSLKISNNGNESLTYTLQPNQYYYQTNILETEEDNTDYAYVCSLDDATVSYNWEDITRTGEHFRIEYFVEHDYVKVGLPEKFTFYGQQYDTMYIYGTGFLTFQHYTDGNFNMPLPPGDIPNAGNTFINYIAPFWGQHAPDETNTSGLYYELKEDRIVISFTEYGNVVNAGINFQAILYHNGRIKFQYKMSDDGHLASLFGIAGMENENHTKGFKLPERYINNGLAVEIYPIAQTTLLPGKSKQVNTLTDATNLLKGIYNEEVIITTNVPGAEKTILPLTLNISGKAVPVFPEEVNFGDLLVDTWPLEGISATFEVRNTGTAAFNITDYYLKNIGDDLCNFMHQNNNGGGGEPGPVTESHDGQDPILVGKEAETFQISFYAPFHISEEIKDTIVFKTDLPNQANVLIPVKINVVNPPVMEIPQGTIDLFASVDTARFDSIFIISNQAGEYQLDYKIDIIHSSQAIVPSAKNSVSMLSTRASETTDEEYTRELKYESVGEPVSYLGTGDEYKAFEAITMYTAPKGGFNVAAIECLATIVGVKTGTITAEIRVGGSYLSAKTIGQGSLKISDNVQEYRTIKLERPVYINENENFFVHLKFPLGAKFPLAFVAQAEKEVFDRYYAFIEDSWQDLMGFSLQYGTIGFVVRCLEKEAGEPWITVEDPNNGHLEKGQEGQLTVHVNAKTARYVKGNRATVKITGTIHPESLHHAFNVNLDKNEGPQITQLTEKIEISENDTLDVEFKVIDKEGNDFTITIEDPIEVTSYQLNQNDLTVTLRTSYDQAGDQNFTVIATDEYQNQSRYVVNYYIQKKNRTPILIIKPENIKANLGDVIEGLDLSQIFNDPDGDTLRYTINSSDPSIAVAFAKDGYLEFSQKAKGTTELTLLATDPYGESVSTTLDLELLKPQSASTEDKITVYPNPVVYLLTITCPPTIEGESIIRMYDMSGNLMYTEKTVLGPDINKTLDMASYPSGVYVLEIECNGEKKSTKVIKQ